MTTSSSSGPRYCRRSLGSDQISISLPPGGKVRDRPRYDPRPDCYVVATITVAFATTAVGRDHSHIERRHGVVGSAPGKATDEPDPLEVLGEPPVDHVGDRMAHTDLEAHPAVRAR
jgi:hypothetical protein